MRIAGQSSKNLHGVHMDNYFEWKKNQFQVGDVAVEKGQGVRLFVQCQEVGKGADSIAQAECAKLKESVQSFR